MLLLLNSCADVKLDGHYVFNFVETRKNLVDERQQAIFSMMALSMGMVRIEIDGDRMIWTAVGQEEKLVYCIKKYEGGTLTAVDGQGQELKLQYQSGRILLPDPVLGIDIVFSRTAGD